MNRNNCPQFSSKSKLLKCIQEWMQCYKSPFRLQEAMKWVEAYLRREGGNVDAVDYFVKFIQDLGIITITQKGLMGTKYLVSQELHFTVESLLYMIGSSVSDHDTTRSIGNAIYRNALFRIEGTGQPTIHIDKIIDPIALASLEALIRWPKQIHCPQLGNCHRDPRVYFADAHYCLSNDNNIPGLHETVDRLLDVVVDAVTQRICYPQQQSSTTPTTLQHEDQTDAAARRRCAVAFDLPPLASPNNLASFNPIAVTPLTSKSIPFADESLLAATPVTVLSSSRQCGNALSSPPLPYEWPPPVDRYRHGSPGECLVTDTNHHQEVRDQSAVTHAIGGPSSFVTPPILPLHNNSLPTMDSPVGNRPLLQRAKSCRPQLSSYKSSPPPPGHTSSSSPIDGGSFEQLAPLLQLTLLSLPPSIYARAALLARLLRQLLAGQTKEQLTDWASSVNHHLIRPSSFLPCIGSSSSINNDIIAKFVRLFANILFPLPVSSTLAISRHTSSGVELNSSSSSSSSQYRSGWRPFLTHLLLVHPDSLALFQPPTQLTSELTGEGLCKMTPTMKLTRGTVLTKTTPMGGSESPTKTSSSTPIYDAMTRQARPSVRLRRQSQLYLRTNRGTSTPGSGYVHGRRSLDSLTTLSNGLPTASGSSCICGDYSSNFDDDRDPTPPSFDSLTLMDHAANNPNQQNQQNGTPVDAADLMALSNRVHLIRLLNNVIGDRQMDARRKLKYILNFREAHPDVFWTRFGNKETAALYIDRLKLRANALAQPNVLRRLVRILGLKSGAGSSSTDRRG